MVREARKRGLLLGAGALAAVVAIAVPVLGAPPSDNPGQGRDKSAKAEKGPELERTVSGTLEQTTDEKGRPTYTITVDGVVWELSAGPKWHWGPNNPLAAWVGSAIDASGTYHEGETELDVETVNGQPLREAGRPPWAGGPSEVGEAHPGWKADEHPGNGLGRDGAPGQQKDKSGDPGEDEGG